MLYFGVQVGLILLPPPPKVMRVLEPPHTAPVLHALRNQLQEKDALIRHLEVNWGLRERGRLGGGPPLLTPPPTTTLIVAPPRMTTSGAGRSRSARSACWSLRGTTW